MNVLLLEDDKKIAAVIEKGLTKAGYEVDHALDGESGLARWMSRPYDVAVVDIMLPRLDGLSVISRVREGGLQTPVLILSAKRSVDERVAGLQAGGDDYLTKPFSFSELLARIQALVRRSAKAAEPTRLSIGELTMDLLSRAVSRNGVSVDLHAREFALLELLMRNRGHVISKTQIMEHVWNYDFDPQTNVVDVLVCRLRNKVDDGSREKMIHTMRGVGYVLKPS